MSLIERLKNPEDYYCFTDPKKANAVLMSLCQEAADALASPVHKPYRPLQDNGSQYFGGSWDTPPAAQRQFVGLTDDEVRKINQEVWGYVSADHARMRGYAHAIEAKLKEKNNG